MDSQPSMMEASGCILASSWTVIICVAKQLEIAANSLQMVEVVCVDHHEKLQKAQLMKERERHKGTMSMEALFTGSSPLEGTRQEEN